MRRHEGRRTALPRVRVAAAVAVALVAAAFASVPAAVNASPATTDADGTQPAVVVEDGAAREVDLTAGQIAAIEADPTAAVVPRGHTVGPAPRDVGADGWCADHVVARAARRGQGDRGHRHGGRARASAARSSARPASPRTRRAPWGTAVRPRTSCRPSTAPASRSACAAAAMSSTPRRVGRARHRRRPRPARTAPRSPPSPLVTSPPRAWHPTRGSTRSACSTRKGPSLTWPTSCSPWTTYGCSSTRGCPWRR